MSILTTMTPDEDLIRIARRYRELRPWLELPRVQLIVADLAAKRSRVVHISFPPYHEPKVERPWLTKAT